jgi:hypothetical protein
VRLLTQAAVSDCTQVGALVALICATPAGSRVDKMKIARAALQRAQDVADAALADLAAVAESVRQQISDALYKTVKPEKVDTAVLLDRKADVCALLAAKSDGTGSGLAQAAADLLTESLTRADADGDLTAYVLTTQLELWFRSHGADSGLVENYYALALGKLQRDGTPPGVAVKALLNGGPHSLLGFISMARVIIFNEMQAAAAQLSRNPFSIQDNPRYAYTGPTWLR